ncbi:hypothetical protein [Agarivorans sp. DSG3-1]|uniref:hypothetical protein n=1 Tax=Agarivorans sp. DSG3-1 TaxID=3342249 RepID=UPI00398F23C9
MTDSFFKKHELSMWIFVVGISVIMTIIIGGGIATVLVVELFQEIFGKFTVDEYLAFNGVLGLTITLIIVATNVLIIRGRPHAVKVNRLNVYFQLASYLLYALIVEHDDKWFGLMFIAFPLLASWLMSSAKYQAFVAYHEALRKNPVEFRQALQKRLFE